MKNLIITEGVQGIWYYHLSYPETFTKSLCDKNTMRTSVSIENWGISGLNTPDKWCSKCEHIANKKRPGE